MVVGRSYSAGCGFHVVKQCISLILPSSARMDMVTHAFFAKSNSSASNNVTTTQYATIDKTLHTLSSHYLIILPRFTHLCFSFAFLCRHPLSNYIHTNHNFSIQRMHINQHDSVTSSLHLLLQYHCHALIPIRNILNFAAAVNRPYNLPRH